MSILVYLIVVSITLVDGISIFLVMNLCQLLFRLNKKFATLGFVGSLILAFVDLPRDEFLVLSVLTAVGVYSILSANEKIKTMKYQIDNHRTSLNELNDKQVNTALYEANLELTARLEERQVIAQKLHDELGHTLSGSTMQLEAALLVLDHDKDKAENMFKQVIDNLRQGTESIRQILKSVKPDNASLNIETLKRMALQVKDKSGVDVRIIYDSDINELTLKQWQVIHLNVQEALTNMMKYAHANKCTVELKRLNRMMRIMIHDDGLGCSKIIKGMGLEGMDERIIAIGGQFITDGSEGFSIIMLLPIEKGKK